MDAGPITSWSNATQRQSYTAIDFRQVFVADEYKDPRTGVWSDPIVHSLSAPFELWGLASESLDSFCIGGFSRSGDFILERWDLVPATEASRSVPLSSPLTRGDDGEILSKDFVRTRIFEGALLERLVAVGYDPEKRFMLALLRDAGAAALYEFDNRPGATAELVSSSTMLPELLAITAIGVRDHVPTGIRGWCASSLTEDVYILWVDVENDGVLDGDPIVGTRDFMEAQGLAWTPSLWQ